MIRFAIILLAASASIAPLASQAVLQDPPAELSQMRTRLQARIERQHIPSVSIAVSQGGKIVWEESFGFSDRENQVRATPHTPYVLGSASKPITATALMVLQKQGKLRLDEPINSYLGHAKVSAHVGNARDATLLRVAQHMAGLPGLYETFYADEQDRPPPMDENIRRYGFTAFPPGERFNYSNLDYGLLGYVISRTSGESFSRFLHSAVFLPLTMGNACLDPCAGGAAPAVRYLYDGSRLPPYITAHPGAADIRASADDLVRFGMFHLKDHRPEQKAIVPDSALDEMQRTTVAMGGANSYGIGWLVGHDTAGRRRVSHGGAGAGVDTQLTLLPDQDTAVVVLLNTNIEGHISAEIADEIVATLFNDSPASTPDQAAPQLPRGGIGPEILGKWTGQVHTYLRDLPVTLEFSPTGDLHATLGGQPVMTLRNVQVEGGRVKGRMTGDIGTPDANRRAYYLDWDLTLRGEVLDGVLYAIGTETSRGVQLGYWVELRKQK